MDRNEENFEKGAKKKKKEKGKKVEKRREKKNNMEMDKEKELNKYRGGTSDATFRRHSFYNFIVIIINFFYHCLNCFNYHYL